MKNQYQSLLGSIDNRLKILNGLKPLTAAEKKRFEDYYKAKEVHASNSIEGNTLTLDETIMVIEKDLVVEGKRASEIIEAKNLLNALVFALGKLKSRTPLSETLIKQLHKRVMSGLLSEDIEGEYKKRGNRVGNIQTAPPNAVPKLMKELIEWYNKNKMSMHPVELASVFKYRFVCIHPFYDGNGRTSRLVVNYIIGLYGYPPIIIDPSIKAKYYKALQESTQNDPSPIIEFMARCLLTTIDDRINLLSE